MVTKVELTTVRMPRDLVNQAREDASIFSRSISGQLEHWAKIGRAVEHAPGFTMDRVRAALDGRFDPADLSEDERRYYYDLLDDEMDNPTPAEIQLIADRAQRGGVGYDDAGSLVSVDAAGHVMVIEE